MFVTPNRKKWQAKPAVAVHDEVRRLLDSDRVVGAQALVSGSDGILTMLRLCGRTAWILTGGFYGWSEDSEYVLCMTSKYNTVSFRDNENTFHLRRREDGKFEPEVMHGVKRGAADERREFGDSHETNGEGDCVGPEDIAPVREPPAASKGRLAALIREYLDSIQGPGGLPKPGHEDDYLRRP
jgi:hypothetical protein